MLNCIGVVSCHLSADTPEAAVDAAVAAGFSTIEWLGLDDAWDAGQGSPEQLAKLASRVGLQNSYHAPWLGRWELTDKSPAEVTATLAELIDRAARMEAELMTLHLRGVPEGAARATHLSEIIGVLADCASQAGRRGVTICVENVPSNLGYCVEDFDALLDATPQESVGLNLDVGHANMTGIMEQLLARHGRRLVNTHLHDNDGASDSHLPPGDGTVDWPALLDILVGLNYRGPLNFEFPQSSGRYAAFMEQLRRAMP